MKGQTSFEALFILLIIISATITITTYYIQTSDVTVATALVRNDLTTQVNSFKDPTFVSRVNITLNSTQDANVEIETNPTTVRPADFNWVGLNSTVLRSTNIKSLSVKVNNSAYQKIP